MKRTQFKRKATKVPKVKKKRSKVAKQPNKRKSKGKSQAQLKKELDRVFSLFIRKVHPPKCYTCGKEETPLQCGHFISRSYLATRFHENNCRPQCVGCNIFGHGKPLDFEEHLKADLGEYYVENLKKLRHQVVKLDRHWYLEQIEKYKLLI